MSKFTDKDASILEKTMSVRESLLHEITKGQLPTDSDGVRMVKDLLDSMDKAVFTKAKIAVDEEKNMIDAGRKAAMQDLVKSLTVSMTQRMHDRDNYVNADAAPVFELPEDSGVEVSEGSLIEGKDEIDASLYIDEL